MMVVTAFSLLVVAETTPGTDGAGMKERPGNSRSAGLRRFLTGTYVRSWCIPHTSTIWAPRFLGGPQPTTQKLPRRIKFIKKHAT